MLCYASDLGESETWGASPHSSHSQEGQCHQEFQFKSSIFASEGEKVKTTNKRKILTKTQNLTQLIQKKKQEKKG